MVGALRRLAGLEVDQCRADVVSRMRGAGFDGVCLCVRGDAKVTDVTASLDSACRMIADRDLPVVALSLAPPDSVLVSSDVDVRERGTERLGAIIEAAGICGLTTVILAPPIVSADNPAAAVVAYADAVNTVYFAVSQLPAAAENAGVTLCLRAPFGGCLLSPMEVRELVDAAASSSVAVCLDGEELHPIGRLDDWVETLHRRIRVLWGVTVDRATPFVPALTRSPGSDLLVVERPGGQRSGHDQGTQTEPSSSM